MMAKLGGTLFDTAFYGRTIAKWARNARLARSADLNGLRRQRLRAPVEGASGPVDSHR